MASAAPVRFIGPQPRWGCGLLSSLSQGSPRGLGQPWAGGHNAFGVEQMPTSRRKRRTLLNKVELKKMRALVISNLHAPDCAGGYEMVASECMDTLARKYGRQTLETANFPKA